MIWYDIVPNSPLKRRVVLITNGYREYLGFMALAFSYGGMDAQQILEHYA